MSHSNESGKKRGKNTIKEWKLPKMMLKLAILNRWIRQIEKPHWGIKAPPPQAVTTRSRRLPLVSLRSASGIKYTYLKHSEHKIGICSVGGLY